ncbi:hypothetical protein ACFWY9_31465 [Amycolatopsis sp. NPDC059027]|uniref:hypothetical protein n=1 Tax=Amycolatopsis sp. NPDC059027 TaxID=3346709 RepID=UPI0036735A6A
MSDETPAERAGGNARGERLRTGLRWVRDVLAATGLGFGQHVGGGPMTWPIPTYPKSPKEGSDRNDADVERPRD